MDDALSRTMKDALRGVLRATAPKSARRYAELADSSQRQADRRREMATHLRLLDPEYKDDAVNDAVARFLDDANVLEDYAHHTRDLALRAGYVPE